MQLPGSYVREHLSLGYASTRDAAQGRNVDIGHAVTRHLAPDAATGETFDTAEAMLADVLANAPRNVPRPRSRRTPSRTRGRGRAHVDQMVHVIREVNAGRTAAALDRLAATGEP